MAAVAKPGLTVSVKFTPQAQADNLVFSEDQVGANSTASTPDVDKMMLANDGGGNAARIMGIWSGDKVAAIQGNLASYVPNYAKLGDAASNGSTSFDLSGSFGNYSGVLGTVSFDGAGNVNFTSTLSFQSLGVGESATIGTFTYVIRMANGAYSVTTANITIAGSNDGPVAEFGSNAGLEDSLIEGQLVAIDIDAHDTLTYAVVGEAPAGFTLNPDGSYTLDASNEAYQHLADGATTDVVVTFQVSDGHGGTDTKTLTITVTGTNDAATITGDLAASITEDDATSDSGSVTVGDVDDGEAHTEAASGDSDEGLGTYTVDADGNWTYSVNNAAVQHLAAGQHASDSFIVTSADGTATETVTVDIVGTNDAATISGDLAASITEDDATSDSGSVTVGDVDDGEAHT